MEGEGPAAQASAASRGDRDDHDEIAMMTMAMTMIATSDLYDLEVAAGVVLPRGSPERDGVYDKGGARAQKNSTTGCSHCTVIFGASFQSQASFLYLKRNCGRSPRR